MHLWYIFWRVRHGLRDERGNVSCILYTSSLIHNSILSQNNMVSVPKQSTVYMKYRVGGPIFIDGTLKLINRMEHYSPNRMHIAHHSF